MTPMVKLEILVLKGWTIYHLTLVAIFAAILLFAAINALVMRTNGGYALSAEASLPYSIDQLWQWTTVNEKRSKWQVGTYDMARLRGESTEAKSTRMLFFMDGEKSWTGVETTLETMAPTLWLSQQETTTMMRIYKVTLEASGPCKTKVSINENTKLYDFTERFWLFWTKSEQQERLNYSLRQLKTWMSHKGEVCDAA
mgnify:CR=1|jgi:hypothetical protein